MSEDDVTVVSTCQEQLVVRASSLPGGCTANAELFSDRLSGRKPCKYSGPAPGSTTVKRPRRLFYKIPAASTLRKGRGRYIPPIGGIREGDCHAVSWSSRGDDRRYQHPRGYFAGHAGASGHDDSPERDSSRRRGQRHFFHDPDLDAEFPALAARQLGWYDVALLCNHELDVPGSLRRCIRVLLHWNTEATSGEIVHVYIKDAAHLRPDRTQLPPVDWDELGGLDPAALGRCESGQATGWLNRRGYLKSRRAVECNEDPPISGSSWWVFVALDRTLRLISRLFG